MKVKELGVSEFGAKLPQEFINSLPVECPICNEDLDINLPLTELTCPNPCCKGKLVERMLGLLQDLGIKGLGEASCRKVVDYWQEDLASPYIIFNTEMIEAFGFAEDVSEKTQVKVLEQIKNKKQMLLWEFIKYANLPDVRDRAKLIFQGYSDLEQFYSDLEEQGIDLILNALGVKEENAESSIVGVKCYNTLIEAQEELLTAVSFVDIIKADTVLYVCLSGDTSYPYATKTDYINQMNEFCAGRVRLSRLDGVNKNCDFVISASESTSKVKKAQKLGIPIYDCHSFKEYLGETYLN